MCFMFAHVCTILHYFAYSAGFHLVGPTCGSLSLANEHSANLAVVHDLCVAVWVDSAPKMAPNAVRSKRRSEYRSVRNEWNSWDRTASFGSAAFGTFGTAFGTPQHSEQ